MIYKLSLNLFVLLVTFSLPLFVQAQTGKTFWFVAPDISSGHADQPIALRLSAYDDSAYVKVSQPANAAFAPIFVGVPADQSLSIDLTTWITDIESAPANTVLNNGLLIESNFDISAYYEVAPSNNTDIFALKAENALGTHFMISEQQFFWSGNYNPQPYATTSIVATENNTRVSITPSNNLVGHPAGVTFNINLNRGETYTIIASGTGRNARFGGTTITSTKNIAVTITDDSVQSSYGGCKDVIGDQTIPINQIGKEYILVKGFLSGDDKIYVMAVQNNTTVEVNNGASSFVLQAGQTEEISLNAATLHLLADKDVYVMHVSGFGCEAGMAIVPSVYCTGSNEVSFTRSKEGDFYLVVFVPAGAEGDFSINGNQKLLRAKDFAPVPGTDGNWVAARKKFSNKQIVLGNNYRVENHSGVKFHLGIINGGSTSGCLYGYFTDFSQVITGPIFHM